MPLNRDVVLDAAMKLLDEAGLDSFSTRRLADALGVRVGALYWHYPSKQALLDAIAERILSEAMAAPSPRSESESGWEAQVRAFALALRGAMLSHPDGARIVTGMSAPGPVARAFLQRLIDRLTGIGMSPADAETGADVVTSYTNGFTIEEQARRTSVPRTDLDAGFEAGLTMIITGLRPLP